MKLAWPMAMIAVSTAFQLAAPARAQEPAPVATIIEVSGPVSWHPAHESAFKEALGGERLYAGAIVRTGVRGHARLTWRNGGDFKLLPLSELAIPEDEGVLLNAGKVWAQFREKLLGPFYFKSPSATAVVRGTTLGVALTPSGDTTVEVLEGRVEVMSAMGGPSRMLEPGQSLTISPFGGLGPIQPIAPDVRFFERELPDAPRPESELRPRALGAFDWLRQNRAAVRLEEVRQQERARLFRAPDGRPMERPEGRPEGRFERRLDGPGGRRGGDRPFPRPPAVAPDRAFPAGRTPDFQRPPNPYCDPRAPENVNGLPADCPPPPPPPEGQGVPR